MAIGNNNKTALLCHIRRSCLGLVLPTDTIRKIHTLLSSLQILQQQIRTNLQKQQDKHQARLNSNTTQRTPKVRDVVYTLSGNQYRPKFDGQFEVIKNPNKHTCIIRELDNQQPPELKVNTHKLKLTCRRFNYLKTNDLNQSEIQISHQGPVFRPR
ncbi:hypothetical protein TNCV_779961 [Trichonephila clavipes]|nr:hypothetical protein TNCV_779961 [Trichonephila clavipes]